MYGVARGNKVHLPDFDVLRSLLTFTDTGATGRKGLFFFSTRAIATPVSGTCGHYSYPHCNYYYI